MKKFCFFLSFLFILAPALSAQCGECKSRMIRVYDLQINLPAMDKLDTVLIHNYYNALKVAPAIAEYLRGSDPSSECLVVRGGEAAAGLTLELAMNSWQTVQQMANSLSQSMSDLTSEQYYIIGSVSGSGQSLAYSFSVYARNGELVVSASGQVPYYEFSTDMVSASVAATMAGQIGTMYVKLYDWEVKKRDSGEPYSITRPEMEFNPEKSIVGVNETTKIKVTFKDCDDKPLANRKFEVSTFAGARVEPASITTDANGEATLEFTSISSTGLISVDFLSEYQEPWALENEKQEYFESGQITVEKPQDAWYIFGRRTMNESNYFKNSVEHGMTNSGNNFIQEDVKIHAWIKIEKHIVGYLTLDTFFVSPTQEPISAGYSGYKREFGGSNGSVVYEIGYIKEEGHFSIDSRKSGYGEPKIYVSLDDAEEADDTYQVKFTGLDAYRDGQYHSTTETFIIYEGTKTENSTTDADTSEAFNWNFQDAMFDTSYSNHDNDGMTETTTSVTQTVKWQDQKTFEVVQEKHMVSVTDFESMGVKDYSKKVRDILSQVYLYYDPQPTDVRDPFEELPMIYSLEQNYPNPFNPYTSFSYSIPKRAWVTIKVFDILGNEVDKIIDEERDAGKYHVLWNAANFTSGVYFYEIRTGNYVEAKKMVLMK